MPTPNPIISEIFSQSGAAIADALKWYVFFPIYAGSAIGVVIGLRWESERFIPPVQKLGKKVLLWSLAFETAFGLLTIIAEGLISQVQKIEIIALETRIAPRFISVDARNRIAEEMKRFQGQEYSGMVASDVDDAWGIWREICTALDSANWHRLLPPGLAATNLGPPAGIPLAPPPGVMILVASERWSDLRSTANALADAITAEGIAAGAAPAGGLTEQQPNAVMIVIGPKPQ
jgi:hypothetical protein